MARARDPARGGRRRLTGKAIEPGFGRGSADSNGSFANASILQGPGGPLPFRVSAVANVERSLDYIGTLRGRLGGLLTPTLLVYGTGGLAYGGVHGETTITQTVAPFGCGSPPCVAGSGPSSGSISETRFGWTARAGLEWLLPPHCSLKAEYLYYDLGNVSWNVKPLTFFDFTGTSCPNPACGQAFSIVNPVSSTRFNGDIVRVGLNYHFGAD